MTVSEARDLFRFDEWANARLAAALSALSEDACTQPIVSSYGSLRETFAHIVSSEWVWLRRWKGESPTSVPPWMDGGHADLVARLAEVETERAAFLDGLADERMDELVVYRRLSGEELRNRLSDLFRHVVNHSTYHRGQAATQLRQLGVVPPSTDFTQYLRAR